MFETFLAGTGAVAIIGALSAWLGRVWAGRILEQDRVKYQTQMDALLVQLNTSSSKELVVHRLQFEKEFSVYLDLWKELLRFGRALSHFRLMAFQTDKSHEEQVQDVMTTYNAFKDRIYDHRPFYAPKIYDLTKDLLNRAGRVFRPVPNGRQTPQQEQEFEQVMQQFNDVDVPKICDAIRERVFPKLG